MFAVTSIQPINAVRPKDAGCSMSSQLYVISKSGTVSLPGNYSEVIEDTKLRCREERLTLVGAGA